jgi:hypothetical protein
VSGDGLGHVDGFFLPQLADADVVGFQYLEYGAGAVRVRYPTLAPGAATRIVERARTAAPRARPMTDVIQAIDAAAALLVNRAHPLRMEAERLLPAVTGYSAPMITHVLDRMAHDWRAPALQRLVDAELADPATLERPLTQAGRQRATLAVAPGLILHVFAGNVPGVAVTSLVRGLLVKAGAIGKLASGEPVLPVLFARALTEIDPRLARSLALLYWRGGADRIEDEMLAAADLVVAYGGEQAVAGIAQNAPASTPIVAHGPKLSFAVVTREALKADALQVARDAAYATAMFDQQGCVSPHFIYVEEGGGAEPAEFAGLLFQELLALDGSLPRGELTPGELTLVRDARTRAEFAEIRGDGTRLFADEALRATVILEPDARPKGSCLNRVVYVKAVADAEDIPALLGGSAIPLQTVGLAADEARSFLIGAMLARSGVTRVTALRSMPWPPAEAHHDGRGPLRELLRWVDLEPVTPLPPVPHAR